MINEQLQLIETVVNAELRSTVNRSIWEGIKSNINNIKMEKRRR